MSAKGQKRLQSKRDCALRDRARTTQAAMDSVITKVVELIGQQLVSGTPVTTLADGRWRFTIDAKVSCEDTKDGDKHDVGDDDDLDDKEDDDEEHEDCEGDGERELESNYFHGLGALEEDDGDDEEDVEDTEEGAVTQDSDSSVQTVRRGPSENDDLSLTCTRVFGQKQRFVTRRAESTPTQQQCTSRAKHFSGSTLQCNRVGSHGKRGGRRRRKRRKQTSGAPRDSVQLPSSGSSDEEVCSPDDQSLADDGPTMEVTASRDGKRYRITTAGELEDVGVPSDRVVVPLVGPQYITVKEWRMVSVRRELPGVPGWLRILTPSHKRRVLKRVVFTWKQYHGLRSAFDKAKLREWSRQQDAASELVRDPVRRHEALQTLVEDEEPSSGQSATPGSRAEGQIRVLTTAASCYREENIRKSVLRVKCHMACTDTEYPCSDWDARYPYGAHFDPAASTSHDLGIGCTRICYVDSCRANEERATVGRKGRLKSDLQVAVDKLESYGLHRYDRKRELPDKTWDAMDQESQDTPDQESRGTADQKSRDGPARGSRATPVRPDATFVRQNAAALSENGSPILIVEGLYRGQSLAIQRWVDRQQDRGRAAVIVNAFGGEPYTGCRLESNNVVTLAVRDPSALEGLEDFLADVLVVGYVADDHKEYWNAFRKRHPELNFVIAADEHYLPTVRGENLFVQPRFRKVCSERWYRGAAAVHDRHIMTVSTIPLAYYPTNFQGFSEADTMINSSEALERALQTCEQDEANSANIPVYALKDLPKWKDNDEKSGSSRPPSLLGYNCNGLRASYVRDDWSKILKDSPDIVAVCEIKGSLHRLQTFLRGTMWASFRALYPFMHVFPARSPNTGAHGTAVFCKHRPDAWVVGMSTPSTDAGLFDREGRQVGLVKGDRYTSVSYAKTAGFMNANLRLTKEYWKLKTEASLFVIALGYMEQGFGDLNIVRDPSDYVNPFTFQSGTVAPRPACTNEERKLIRDFFIRTAFLDFCHTKDEGKDRFTYYHTLRDRINGDGLRIDYIYGNFATWAEGRMVVRHDIPGDDHLPVQWQPPADFIDGKYEEDCNFKDLTPLCAMMRELNPRELDTKDVLRLGNVLKAIDESRSNGLGSDNHGHSSDDGQTVDLKIRRIYRLTVRSAKDDTSCPPMLGFQFNGNEEELHIVDSGADVSVISMTKARKILGDELALHGTDSPLRLAGVFGHPQVAEGYVNIPVRLTYDEGRQIVEKTIKFYVFEDPDTPTLMGFPAMTELGVGLSQKWDAQKRVNVPIALITDKNVRTEEPLRKGAPHSGCFALSEASLFIPVVAAADCVVRPGRNLLRVRVPDNCTEVCMSMANMDHVDADGEGFLLENNTFQPEDGFAHVTLNVTAPQPIHISEGLHLNDAMVLPKRCSNLAKFVKNDLPLPKSRSFSQQDLGRTFRCYRARGEAARSEHCLRTDRWARVVRDSPTDGEATATAASPSATPQPRARPDTTATSVPAPASDPPNGDELSHTFWRLPRYEKFQQGGLSMFRPSADEVRRLRDVPEYTADGAKVDTFDDICQVLLRAGQKDVVYEKGSALPVAREEAVVTLKPNAKKVTAGYAQNNRGPGEERVVQAETDKLVQINAAEKVNYEDIEYCSRIMLVPKPNGDWRFCVDLRGVNKNVELEHWPLTKVDIRLQGMSGAQFFSTLDLPQAFHNIPLAEESRKYFGFKAPNGLYRYKTLPMGFVNSMALFTRLMDMSMIGLGSFVSVYVDDLIVFSRDWSQHMDHLDQVFTRLQHAGLKVNLAKCAFAREQVPFLGHLVTREGVTMDPAKVAALDRMELPDDLTKLRSFLGATGHYRKFVKDYSMIARPLSDLTKKCSNLKQEIQKQECKQSFESLKAALRSGQVLQHPDIDRQWVLSCDASKYGVACVLQQRIPGLPDCDDDGKYTTPKPSQLRPVAFFSKKLSAAETKNYCIYEKEAYALVWGIEACRSYIMGSRHPVLVFTDNKALSWLRDQESPGRLGRWQAELGMYNMNIVHQPGAQNVVPDGFSRNPIEDVTGIEVSRIRRTGRAVLGQTIDIATMFDGQKRWLKDSPLSVLRAVEYTRMGPYYMKSIGNGRELRIHASNCSEDEINAFWCALSDPTTASLPATGVHPQIHCALDVRPDGSRYVPSVRRARVAPAHDAAVRYATCSSRVLASAVVDDCETMVRANVLTRSQMKKAGQPVTDGGAEDADGQDDEKLDYEHEEVSHDADATEKVDVCETDVLHDATDPVIELRDTEQIRQMQREDGTWKPVIAHVDKYSKYWETAKGVDGLPGAVSKGMTPLDSKLYPIYQKQFRIDANGLLRRRKTLKDSRQSELVVFDTLCVPQQLVKGILRFHHGTPISGHLGINKLQGIMSRRYHWPKMDKDIRRWVNGCATCQKRKQYRRLRYGLYQPYVSERPWQRACMDLVGPLPETDDGNRYLLTIVDTFSKWPMAIPLPNKKAETIAQAVYKNLIAVHGCPEELFSDNEATLLASATTLMCERLGIKRITSSSYAPWQNGQVERFHRFLGASLSIYASEQKKDWDTWVDCILFTYRVSVHAQSGESPYRIIYNRDPVLGADTVIGHEFPAPNGERPASVIADTLEGWFKRIALRQKLLARTAMLKANANGGRSNPTFHKDDWVLLYEPPVTHTTATRTWKVPKKFQDGLTGPHRIVSDSSNGKGEWKIVHSRRNDEEWVHVSRLVRYNPWSDDFLNTAEGSQVPGHDIRAPSGRAADDEEPELPCGDDVSIGDFAVIVVNKDELHKIPLMIVKVTELGEHFKYNNEMYRLLDGQIWGNAKSNLRGVYRPCWLDNDKRPYFRHKKEHHSHVPLTASINQGAGAVSTYNVAAAQFKLNSSDKLPRTVISALERSPYIDWSGEDSEQ